jgi:hypothetical protein
VDVSLHHDALRQADRMVRPWRLAAIAAAAFAAVELLLLVVVGGALIAQPAKKGVTHPATAAKTKAVHAQAVHRPAPVRAHRAVAASHLGRRQVRVLVLNGNGRQGAAAAAASRVSRRGYRIGGVANAPHMDFTRSLVMYRKGFEGEGRRLAHDMGVKIVGPLDGLRTAQLHGAHVVIVVGA